MMRKKNILENFIFLAIILVIIQTFLDDFSQIQGWSVALRHKLLISGFIFDLLFTIEFLVRTISSIKIKKVKQYWFYKRGWVDFLSSVPLLLLNSGPALFFLYFGDFQGMSASIGILNIAKVLKVIRITRILRLLRVMKIFGKIQNAGSTMAQHHIAAITTTAVFTVICTLIGFSLVSTLIGNSTDEAVKIREHYYYRIISNAGRINSEDNLEREKIIREILHNDLNIIKIISNGRLITDNQHANFKEYFSENDYGIASAGGHKIYFSLKDINSKIAFNNILNFIIIIFLIIGFMLFYSRHFVQNISDIVFVMNKGFKQSDYLLQVKMKEEFKEHEIFKLAQFYNEAYLPAKIKRNEKKAEQARRNLSMKDLLKFKK